MIEAAAVIAGIYAIVCLVIVIGFVIRGSDGP